MRGKRGGGRHVYRGWSREARDATFFGGTSSVAGHLDEEDADRPSSGVQILLPHREEDETLSGGYRGWSHQTRDPSFFGSSSTPRPVDDAEYSNEDVDRMSSSFQQHSYRVDEETLPSKEQRMTSTSSRDRRDNVLTARSSVMTPEKLRKEQGPVILTKDSTMTDGVKFINDNMDVCDQLLEFLSGENSNYNVISAIGPQGAGKSTILSMIGGNNSQDMYRQYIFRPASREALESSRHQTTKIHAYITKFKQIFLDCQASNCASVLDEAIRYSRSALTDGRYAINNYMEIVKLIAFLVQISHTLLVCSDWLIDIELIKLIRTAEMFRANFEHVTEKIPHYNATREVNLVVLHTRAKSDDFSSDVLQQRAALLRTFFSDSRRIRVSGEDDLVIFPLADIKPRKDGLSGAYPREFLYWFFFFLSFFPY
uniref:Protein SMG9 n=1 Tax=Angiostrongylus cantonensis TaxID=6313 RepID=A0A0K0D064_ANGCA